MLAAVGQQWCVRLHGALASLNKVSPLHIHHLYAEGRCGVVNICFLNNILIHHLRCNAFHLQSSQFCRRIHVNLQWLSTGILHWNGIENCTILTLAKCLKQQNKLYQLHQLVSVIYINSRIKCPCLPNVDFGSLIVHDLIVG